MKYKLKTTIVQLTGLTGLSLVDQGIVLQKALSYCVLHILCFFFYTYTLLLV